ncbi:unnamed product [Ostreococcus tauri]|uniref:Unnamed product n=1 Tax=Ostreococcus tauri TaxID=70448 RepID=Q01FD8_OSTTA|nr:unnamed product [Ostreococcus tauri]OUS42337.1 hypothetical protein BE221DRAFT_186994 [Ostreococcus tauri]CAL50556.1 unnamed product [Ostreococcus tauri]|eukprot:XP_003074706.1 unnamed product [Ostreococcus tauri]
MLARLNTSATSTSTTLIASRRRSATKATTTERSTAKRSFEAYRAIAPLERSNVGPRARRAIARAGRRQPQEGDRVGDREDPDLYIGTYSTFWSDPKQLQGVAIFCAFLLSFFSLGNVGAALILPILYGTDQGLGDFCIQSLLFGYYCN